MRRDLIAMASEAGFGKLLTGNGLPPMWYGTDLNILERFAAIVAAAEREANKEICTTLQEGCQNADMRMAYGYVRAEISMRQT